MATIDTSKIEGYADMSPEDKIAALEAYSTPDPDLSGYVKKDLYDKAAHDAADWKKKHNALLSEDERTKAEQAEKWNQMQSRLEELEAEKTTSGYVAQFTAQGYSAELAAATADALAKGDMATVFANQQKFLEEHDKALRAEKMRDTKRPPNGDTKTGSEETIADLNKKKDEALAEHNYANAAYYTRLIAEEMAKQKEE